MEFAVAVEDPLQPECRSAIDAHLQLAKEVTPPDHVHALDFEALNQSGVSFYGVRHRGALVGVGALRRLDDATGEIKAMHVVEAARRGGAGTALVKHLLHVARQRGWGRVSLETGTHSAFASARRLYRACGFEVCEPFADYTDNPYSMCMTIALQPASAPTRTPARLAESEGRESVLGAGSSGRSDPGRDAAGGSGRVFRRQR